MGAAQLVRLAYTRDGAGLEFAIDRTGRRVWATWVRVPRRKPDDLAALLVGGVLGVVLRLRGIVSLHGSVLEVGSRSVVLVGRWGAGKSTVAAAMAQQGNAVLSDDVAAIAERSAGTWLAQPGCPRLRLLPAAIDALAAPVSEATVMTESDKRYVELRATDMPGPWRFQAEPRPLEAIYEPRRDANLSAPVVEPVAGAECLTTLVRHASGAQARLDPSVRADELARLGRLVASVPIRRVACPDDLSALPAVCQAIVDDARSGAVAA
jgi:hypothetical protein